MPNQNAMILAHKRGVECARERGSRQDMLAHCAIFPTMEERDAFLAGYYRETRRLDALCGSPIGHSPQ